ncbi:MAG: hypothetical protein AAF604_09750 [Acidobacteriota bacterium]
MRFNEFRSELPEHGLTFLAEIPYVYHCHHFNLFHDQSIEDALGEDEANQLKVEAAHEAFRGLLSRVISTSGASTPAERLELATALFGWMGHGRMELLVDGSAGHGRGEFLHYSFAWREKYGSKVKRLDPLDGVAAGFAAAAVEVAHDLPFGSVSSRESACYGKRDPFCEFELTPTSARPAPKQVDQAAEAGEVGSPLQGLDEDRIAAISQGLREFLSGVEGDERGLVQAFNVFAAMHLPTYYNRTAYEALRRVAERAPAALPAAQALFGESGHVCVFYTFGNLLLSAEWEGLVGPLSGAPEDTVAYCCAIARGLGFGHWALASFEQNNHLVLRTPSNYESPFYRVHWGAADQPCCHFFSHSARAMMHLAHDINLGSKPQIDDELYQTLFRSGVRWNMEETRCVSRGDDHCEVVVEKA